jgi:subtilase family serine protease
VKVKSMSDFKHRVISGALVFLCLLTGLSAPAWCHGTAATALAAADAKPDLVIASLALSPEAPSIGNKITFTVTIKNQGDGQAGASELNCFIDENPLANSVVGPIDAGAASVVTCTWKAQAGPHILQAVINGKNSVAESDESNNDKSYAFSVIAPDLAVDAISWEPLNPSMGDKVTFTVTIVNRGDKRAGVSHTDFSIDGSSRGYHTTYAIEAGDSTNETFLWTATPGVHNIGAAVDVLSQVTESDETNNASEATLATAIPDLIVAAINFSPESPAGVGDNITMTINVKNQGSGRSAPFSLSYFRDDTFQEIVFLGFLDAGATTDATFQWFAESGPHTFKFIADAANLVEESDETNNSLATSYPQVFPDLIIQDITWTPSIPSLYGPVITTITVKNQGKCEAGPAQLKFGIDTIYQFTSNIPELSVNGTSTVTFMWITLYESHTVEAAIDQDNVVKESNESNNTLAKTIKSVRVTPSADLTLVAITCSPARPVIDGTVTLTLEIKNQGTGRAAPSSALIYIDDSPVDSVYIDEMEAGAALSKDATLSLKGLPFQDKYNVRVRLDGTDLVAETDETNNEKQIDFSVFAPDLCIQAIRWSPEIPAAGDTVNFDVTVKNRGDLEAGSCYISYYVNKVFMGRHLVENIEPGATVTRPFSWAAQQDSLIFTAVIDEDGEINESDESNNTKTVSLPAPDILIDAVTWTPAYPAEFSQVTFTAVIKNQGHGPAPKTSLPCYIDGAAILSLETDEISPGGSAKVSFSRVLASGEHTIRITADGDDAITETDETNNEKTLILLVQSRPASTSSAATGSGNITAPGSPVPGSNSTGTTGEKPASQNNTPAQLPGQEVAAQITAPPSGWQGVLQNRWLIMGIAALGIGAIGVLLLIRRKGHRK